MSNSISFSDNKESAGIVKDSNSNSIKNQIASDSLAAFEDNPYPFKFGVSTNNNVTVDQFLNELITMKKGYDRDYCVQNKKINDKSHHYRVESLCSFVDSSTRELNK